MSQIKVHQSWYIGFLVAWGLIGAIATPQATAQITPDSTLGNEGSRIIRNVTIRGGNADRIDGGATRGSNLFHSFLNFNVNEGQRVYFANPVGVQNILTRVTGNTASDIMGTLGVDGSANLFVLNPNGIIFGPNAQLDISGSFTASTANSFTFPGGSEFSAANPGDSSLLSVAVPLGVQYGAASPGAIANAGNLTVGQHLSLSGGSVTSSGQLAAPGGQLLVEGGTGDVQVRQAIAQTATLTASNNLILQESQLQTAGDLNLQAGNTVQVRDSVANPFVAYAGGNLHIQGNQGIDILALNHPQIPFVSEGNLSLVSDGIISGDAHFSSGETFQIRSVSGQLAHFTSLYDPIISSTGNVDIIGGYGGATSLLIESQGSVRIQGNVTITTPDRDSIFVGTDEVLDDIPGLIIRSGATALAYSGVSQNTPPPVFTDGTIPDGITLDGAIRVEPLGGTILPGLDGQRGIVNLTAARGNIVVADIDASGPDGGGNITIVRGIRGNPNSGNINVGNVSSNVAGGSGFPGRISITNENGSISLNGTISTNGNTTNDDPNTIEIAARNGSVQLNGATLTADTNGSGRDITLTASGDIFIRNSTISSTGNFGRIFVGTSPLVLNSLSTNLFRVVAENVTFNNSRLNTRNSSGVTQSGAIIVYATDSIRMRNTHLNGGGVSPNPPPGRSENSAASIFVNSQDIRINHSTISTEGGFGRILIGSSLFACGTGCNSANPTLIEVVPPGFSEPVFPKKISISNRSRLSTQSLGNSPNAGDIAINASNNISIYDSRISSEGSFGRISVGSVNQTNQILSNDANRISQAISSPRAIILNNGSAITTRNTVSPMSNTSAAVNAGSITIQATDRISILNRSGLVSDTVRNGNSGNIRVRAGNAPIFDGSILIDQSIVSSQVLRGGTVTGSSGSVTTRAGSLNLTGGGQINTTLNDVPLLRDGSINRELARLSAPQSQAGNVTVNVTRHINISGGNRRAFSGIFSAVGNGNPNAERDGRFNPSFLGLSFAKGEGGRVRINSGSLSIDGISAGIFTRTVGRGDAGDVFINTGSLMLSNGGSLDNSTARFVSANRTNGRGDAGNITVRADRIALNNGSINVEATRILSPSSLESGKGSSVAGSIDIQARELVLEDGSTATVESQFGQAGRLEVTANRVTLDNSTLNANAGNARGERNNANITLTISGALLQLEGTRPRSLITQTSSNELISANAIGAVDGGNITINAENGFVLANANDNGDITANATDRDGQLSGDGGRVNITANAIFGLERRAEETRLSDITATSQSGNTGTITLNTLNVDPTRGLGELPVDIVDTAGLVADGCVGRNRSGVTDQGEFTQTGRGGLSANPDDPLTNEATSDRLATLDPNATPSSSASIPDAPIVESLIVEAQGLGLNSQGKVSLVSNSFSSTPSPSVEQPATCATP